MVEVVEDLVVGIPVLDRAADRARGRNALDRRRGVLGPRAEAVLEVD
jgi:hypothetical protein